MDVDELNSLIDVTDQTTIFGQRGGIDVVDDWRNSLEQLHGEMVFFFPLDLVLRILLALLLDSRTDQEIDQT